MKLLFDLHTHTVASGHAFSTLKENIEEAAAKGLKAMGTSDHYSAMPGSAQPIYFTNFKAIKEKILGVRIFTGMEANIIDLEGKLDAEEAVLKKMDYVIASLHVPCVKAGTREENTNDDRFPLDYEKLVKAAAKEKVALEVNNSSFSPRTGRLNADKNLPVMLSFCKKYKVPVIVDSDAHIFYDIGNLDRAKEMLEACEFPKKLILNTKLKGLSYVLNLEREETREKYDHMMED